MFREIGILGGLVVCFLLALFFSGTLTPLLQKAEVANAGHVASYIGYGIAGVLLIIVAAITKCSIGAWMLFVLFVAHALVGAVELGTDGWIQNITGNILTPAQGKILFVWTSFVMFGLRFCAHWIERTFKLSPPSLLMVCSIVAAVGLNLVSGVNAFITAMAALTVYAAGKAFFWPTMLAVAGDRFPRTGAIAMSFMGGIGMMSAGIIGSAGLGYCKDRFSTDELQKNNPEILAQYKAEKASKFLFLKEVPGIDGKKLEAALNAKDEERTPDQKIVVEASIKGDRKTLVADSFIPAAMAVIYLLLVLYFKATGGYKVLTVEGGDAKPAESEDEESGDE